MAIQVSPTKPTDFSQTRNLTEPEVRAIISQRMSGQLIPHIASGMNLPTNIVRRVVRGEAYQMVSAGIFAKMVFPGLD